MSKITKDDIDWDNYPAYIAGETKPKILTEAEKDEIVKHHNDAEELLKNDPSVPRGAADEQRALMLRNMRNGLLRQSDWTQQPDVPEETRTKWQSYRQALRDITKHENFPNITEEDFPTKPS